MNAPSSKSDVILRIEDTSVQFGGLKALAQVGMNVEEREIRGIIGPNGAGKTTLFNVLTGLYRPTSGKITFSSVNITGWPPYRIAALGITRTFQNIRLFPNMSVFDNILVGQHTQSHSGWFPCMLRLKPMRSEENSLRERAHELISFVDLRGEKNTPAKDLPYGKQRRVELARSLASKPKLLLLDEPTAGMNSNESSEMMDIILKIRELGVTILLVEHDMKVAMGISDKITVLDMGNKIAEDSPSNIQKNKMVIAAYLGKEI